MSKENSKELEPCDTFAQDETAKACKSVKVDYNEMVSYMVPHDMSAKKSKTIRLSLNGKSITFPRGELVQIPLKYKLMLEKKAKLREMDNLYKESIVKAMEAEEAKQK